MKLGSVVKDGKPLKVAEVVYRDGDHNLEVSFDPTQTQPTAPATGGGEEGEPVAATMGWGEESEAAAVAMRGQEENQPPAEVKVKSKVADNSTQGPTKHKISEQEPEDEVEEEIEEEEEDEDEYEDDVEDDKDDFMEPVLQMNALRSRELIEYLMDCLDLDSMCLDLGGRGKLPVTPYVVHCVLGLQNGHLDPPIASDTTPLGPIREEIGLCIMMILFSKLLALDSSIDITGMQSTWCITLTVCCASVGKAHGKGKVAAASENTRKRKHMDEEVAKVQLYKDPKKHLLLVVTSQAFATNDDLGKEQSKGGVESSAPMHVEDPTHAAAGQPCAAATDAHNDNDAELSNLVDKICTNAEGTHTPTIAPSHVADPSPVIMPIEMEKRRPLGNPKYTSLFKCASTEPLWDDNGDNAMEVYKIEVLDSKKHNLAFSLHAAVSTISGDCRRHELDNAKLVGRFLDVLDVMYLKKFTDVRKWKCFPACV
uniref:Uncharacterized protein n=1 Tax=Oryza punctata TaxID=4537 RepID=A0A0E0JR46_ORYPU